MPRLSDGRFPEHGDDEILPDGVKGSRYGHYDDIVILFFLAPVDTL